MEAIPWNVLSNLTMSPIVKFILNTKSSHSYQTCKMVSIFFYRFLAGRFADNILCRKQSWLHSMIGRLPGNTKSSGNRVPKERCSWFMMIVPTILLNFLHIEWPLSYVSHYIREQPACQIQPCSWNAEKPHCVKFQSLGKWFLIPKM